MTILDRAILFAVEAHSGACRKGSQTPYVLHPLEAAAIAASLTDDLEVLAAAVLHDVLEDTAVTPDALEAQFGPRVRALVSAETEEKYRDLPPAATWRRRKEEALVRLRADGRREVLIVAMGDKLSNLRALCRAWTQMGNDVWQLFHQTDPAAHAWYYRQMGELFAPLRDTPAWQEYQLLCARLWPPNSPHKA